MLELPCRGAVPVVEEWFFELLGNKIEAMLWDIHIQYKIVRKIQLLLNFRVYMYALNMLII